MNKLPIAKFNKFLGVFDKNEPWEIPVNREDNVISLSSGVNFDINRYFKLKFRNGRVLKLSGDYKNLWSNGQTYFATKGNNLYQIIPGSIYTESVIQANVGSTDMDYSNIEELVYMTNSVIILAYEDGTIRSLRSPVNNFEATMPPGHILELFMGRMFIAKETSNGQHLIMQSKASNYELYDTRDDKSYLAMPAKVTTIKAVRDGFYVSSDRTYFFKGSNLTDMLITKISDYKIIPGTAKKVRGLTINGELYNNAVIWRSEDGICVGGDGGKYINLIEGRLVNTDATSGASYIKLNDINQYVVNTKV